MLLQRSCALLVAAAIAAQAFKESTPFLLLSTEGLKSNLHSSQIATSSDVEDQLLDSLSDSAAQLYLFISSPSLSASDFHHLPHLQSRAGNSAYRGKVEIPEIIGGRIDSDKLASRLGQNRGISVDTLSGFCEEYGANGGACKLAKADEHGRPRQDAYPAILTEVAARISEQQSERVETLKAQDQHWEFHLAPLLNLSVPHVVILTAGAADIAAEGEYDMDRDEPEFQSIMHTDLKRDLHLHASRAKNSSEWQAGLPLFERYQFLSPGIFMGLSVSLLLFIILYVGISAIAGLEVSYAAFNKEMGPGAQNKGKQP